MTRIMFGDDLCSEGNVILSRNSNDGVIALFQDPSHLYPPMNELYFVSRIKDHLRITIFFTDVKDFDSKL